MNHIISLLTTAAATLLQPTQEQRWRQKARQTLALLLVLSAVLLLQPIPLVLLNQSHHQHSHPVFVPPSILRAAGLVRVALQAQGQQRRDVYQLFIQSPRLCRVSTRCSPEELADIVAELSPLVAQPRDIYNEFGGQIRRPRRCILSTANRITMVLVWMAHYDVLERLAGEFGISAQLVFLDVYHILPFIIARFSRYIQWPGEAEREALEGGIPPFAGAVGYVDGSHSAIYKPGSTSEDWETEFWCTHGDERTHTMAVQITTNYHGVPIHGCFGLLGAGNDQGNFWLSTLPVLPVSEGQYLIGDAEYQNFARILSPYHSNGREQIHTRQ